jgi:hypothetical protein
VYENKELPNNAMQDSTPAQLIILREKISTCLNKLENIEKDIHGYGNNTGMNSDIDKIKRDLLIARYLMLGGLLVYLLENIGILKFIELVIL